MVLHFILDLTDIITYYVYFFIANGLPSTAMPKVTFHRFVTILNWTSQHFTWVANAEIGYTIMVTLGSNPTTGFTWPDIAQISNQEIVKQTDHKFVSPDQTAVPGASGKDVWTFKALKTGPTTISMDYSQPWADGEKAEWTFIATIIVK